MVSFFRQIMIVFLGRDWNSQEKVLQSAEGNRARPGRLQIYPDRQRKARSFHRFPPKGYCWSQGKRASSLF